MFGRHRDNSDFLILALSVIFLFRTFVAEPFQIPTGSMGPTLLGRHKRVVCPHCDYPVVCSSSEEVDFKTGTAWQRLVSAECPNCRGSIDISKEPSHDGDRLLVSKNPVVPLQRFEVGVFKNIDTPRAPYVKRFVGLPGETIRIHRGEIERLEEGYWRICRKSPEQILSTAVTVYDDHFRARDLPMDWPARWASVPPQAWTNEGNTYVLTQEGASPAQLEYRHVLRHSSRPRLITDDLGYNSALSETQNGNSNVHRTVAGHPVQDLLVELRYEVPSSGGEIGIDLAAGESIYQWRGNRVAQAIFANGREIWRGGPLRQAGAQFLQFGQVDCQLLLWQNGIVIACVALGEENAPNGPTEKDLRPVSIAAKGIGFRISDLVLRRDIYYTRRSQASDYFRPTVGAAEMDDFLSNPKEWTRLRRIAAQTEPWVLGEGEYIALGDNSLQSNDSRHWRQGPIVDERMILGRAEWLVWPVSGGRPLRIR